MDKKIITKNFSKNAASYDAHSKIQMKCAEILITSGGKKEKIRNILEIGCGTGAYTRLLREEYTRAEIKAVDISEKMIQQASGKILDKGIQFEVCDGEKIFFKKKFDLITSNASFQWFGDIGRALGRFPGFITDNGSLNFSIYGPATFKELNTVVEIYFGRGQCLSSSRFMSFDKLGSLLKNSFFKTEIKKKSFKAKFPSLRNFLREIKKSGAGGEGLPRDVFLGRKAMEDMEKIYIEKFGSITATHEVYFCKARK